MLSRPTSPGTGDSPRSRRRRLFYVQPLVAPYRLPVIAALDRAFDLAVFAEVQSSSAAGFPTLEAETLPLRHAPIRWFAGGRLAYQHGVVGAIVRERPDLVLHFANTRFLSFWLALIVCRFLGIGFHAHGQGLFGHPAAGAWRRLLYRAAVAGSTRYLCYTDAGRDSLIRAGCSDNKLRVVANSIALSATVQPCEKSGTESGVLFLGRLRDGCRVDLLVEAIDALRRSGLAIDLDIVGDGVQGPALRSAYGHHAWIRWHGRVDSHDAIARISRHCRVCCYGGDAGLSVVHGFGLSLPVIVHDGLESHMGPEPAYVRNGFNGLTFARGDLASLGTVLERFWAMDLPAVRRMAAAAWSTYESLNAPSLGERLIEAIG